MSADGCDVQDRPFVVLTCGVPRWTTKTKVCGITAENRDTTSVDVDTRTRVVRLLCDTHSCMKSGT